MKQYSYSGKNSQKILVGQWAGCMGFVGMSPVVLLPLISILFVPLSPYPEESWSSLRLSLLCWAIIVFFFGFTGSSFFINHFPTIWTDEEAIYISYFILFRLKIPWNQIIDIKTVKKKPKFILVRARRITPWHIHHSLYYSFSFRPGFLIRESIDDFDELVREINQRIEQA